MGKHRKNTPPGDYSVGYKKPPPPKKGEVRRKAKPVPAQPVTRADALRASLGRRRKVIRAGREQTMSAWEKILRRTVKDILVPEQREGETLREMRARKRRAMKSLIQVAEKNGWFDVVDETKIGFLAIYNEPASVEAWMEKYGGDGKLPANPLEGIPGLQPELLTHKRRMDFDDDDI